MIKNAELKTCLQELAKSFLEFYNKHLPYNKLMQYEEAIRFGELLSIGSKMMADLRFNECISVMEKDENIQVLKGKLVGTCNSVSMIPDNDIILLSFLAKLYINNPTYDKDIFNRAYSSFEELFYYNSLIFKDSSRLNNFYSDSLSVELGHDTYIRRNPVTRVVYKETGRSKSWTYTEPHVSDFVLERLYKREKIISEPNIAFKPKDGDSKQGLSTTIELFDIAIAALRILKPSAVFRDAIISSELQTFHPMQNTSYSKRPSETIVQGERCVIDENDITELKRLFSFLVSEKDSRFNVAQRRLSLGMERSSLEDRLIDYMIGLEALYLPDGRDELTFRLSLRIAFLLFPDPDERKETYYFIKNLYAIRSSIVHGEKYSLVINDIIKLEDLLRKSLKLWIDDKSNFLTNDYSNSGRLKSEGALSNLFFKVED